ncbi:LysR substrate-binding domain-containing protein [Acidobacteriia bacterium AH_259_A11_L15]|nr:LysR substrate-binding domain-containing protein [Acidobacteriia bacterium AH_259_A11_L15]
MDFRELEVFLAVAREKSFSRAAKSLLRTQPAVSLAIRRLEEELGESLFDRTSKIPSLTDAGELLLEHGRRLVNLRGEIRPALAELRNLERGRVRVGANETGALYLLPLIARYRRLYPHVMVKIVRSLARNIPQELLNRNLDLGVLSYRPAESHLKSAIVYRDRLSFIVYPTHPLARRRRVSMHELGQEVFAAHNVWSPYRERVLRTFEKHRVPLHMDVELPTVEAIKKFVQMRQAVALVPRMCIEEELAKGAVVEVEIPELRIERKLRVVYRRGDSLSHAARAFLRVVTTQTEKVALSAEVNTE